MNLMYFCSIEIVTKKSIMTHYYDGYFDKQIYCAKNKKLSFFGMTGI